RGRPAGHDRRASLGGNTGSGGGTIHGRKTWSGGVAVRDGEGFEARPYGPRHLRGGRRGDVEGLAEGEEPGFEVVR
ncbi:hypothetical protein AB0J28_50885, partial [Streptosporangium canum]|uniref:hypothetical protein n=1 Tax=Streptosporangium canum TaxID=324952 RepID=UPI003446E4E0